MPQKIDKYGLPDDSPDSWAEAVGKGTLGGYGFGAIVGTMHASWSDSSAALRDQSWPGLKRTVQITNHWGVTFATVGASYAAAKVGRVDVEREPSIATLYHHRQRLKPSVGRQTGGMVPLAGLRLALLWGCEVRTGVCEQKSLLDTSQYTANAGFKSSVGMGVTLAIGSMLVDLTDGRMRSTCV